MGNAGSKEAHEFPLVEQPKPTKTELAAPSVASWGTEEELDAARRTGRLVAIREPEIMKLVAQLGHDDPEVRDAATLALRKRTDLETLDAMKEASSSADPEVRRRAALVVEAHLDRAFEGWAARLVENDFKGRPEGWAVRLAGLERKDKDPLREAVDAIREMSSRSGHTLKEAEVGQWLAGALTKLRLPSGAPAWEFNQAHAPVGGAQPGTVLHLQRPLEGGADVPDRELTISFPRDGGGIWLCYIKRGPDGHSFSSPRLSPTPLDRP